MTVIERCARALYETAGKHWLEWYPWESDHHLAVEARKRATKRAEIVLAAANHAGAVVIDDAAITRAADAIGALGTDRIGAEPYAAARAILDAARGQ